MSQLKIALAGNPNCGKTSLFNVLTGLNQRVGNYPGVTVDKKTGYCQIDKEIRAQVIDLPGIYGLYPKSEDEYVSHMVLTQPNNPQHPDLVIVVADATSLKRNLLLCSQIMDLKIPVVLALSMVDIAVSRGIDINTEKLAKLLNIPVVITNPRSGKGTNDLLVSVSQLYAINDTKSKDNFIAFNFIPQHFLDKVKNITNATSDYAALQMSVHADNLLFLNTEKKEEVNILLHQNNLSIISIQTEDILTRYKKIDIIIEVAVTRSKSVHHQNTASSDFTNKADKWLMHPVLGYVFLFAIMFLVFQSIFSITTYPMDWIDTAFGSLQSWTAGALPDSWWANLITEGIIAGIGGIVVFVPQIAILFFFITILEDSGYMARISVLSDRMMQAAGMNGRSVVPLISGMACAIPAVMAARTISNAKERLLTILVTPLMSCSARLPVYAIIISMVIPEKTVFGLFNLQGLVMMAMYFLGFVAAILVSLVLNFFIKIKGNSFFLMELPTYRMPRWKNAFITMYEKAMIFVIDAGRVILVISVALWFLASYGPADIRQKTEQHYIKLAADQDGKLTEEQAEALANEKLSTSYIGILGRTIEPVVAPLGYDWKIGIALLTSFAAREVFVGTVATLYNVGDVEENEATLKEKMRNARREDGTPVYTLATGMSLLMFYAFAMQCMSTIAIVRRETKSIKWTTFQFGYMTVLAYIMAFVAYSVSK